MSWRGFPRWRSDDEDVPLGDASSPERPAVEDLLAALTAEPRPHELDGLAGPVAAYRAVFVAPEPVPATPRRGLALAGLFSARAAAAVGGVAIGLAATAMAFAVGIPASPDDDAPVSAAVTPAAASSTPQPSATRKAVGPDATGPAAHGLCTAWSNHVAHGDTAALDSVPMRNLAVAAGGKGQIAAYCAAVPHPGQGQKDAKPGPGDKPKAKPSQRPKDEGADDGDAPGTARRPAATSKAQPSPQRNGRQ